MKTTTGALLSHTRTFFEVISLRMTLQLLIFRVNYEIKKGEVVDTPVTKRILW